MTMQNYSIHCITVSVTTHNMTTDLQYYNTIGSIDQIKYNNDGDDWVTNPTHV